MGMVITVSRECCAGGSFVAQGAAEALRWHLADREFIGQLAQRTGIPADEVSWREERAPSFAERFARSTVMAAPELFPLAGQGIEGFEEERLARTSRCVIQELASQGNVVIVGRAASAVLQDDPDCMHVRLVAPKPFRVELAIRELGLSADEAAQTVDDADRNRERYYREYYDTDWGNPTNYHLVLNTAALGIEGATAVVIAQARARWAGR